MANPNDEPLIYTTKGNIPMAGLIYEYAWEDTPNYTKFVERYRLGDEVVKESAHVMQKRGISLAGETGKF